VALAALPALLLAVPAGADQVTAAVSEKTVREDVFPPVSAPFPDGIVAVPGVEFENLVGFRPVRMDLYLHVDRHLARPLVLWIHGGGWNRGDARTSANFANWPAVLASLAARGYVVASIDYRLSGEARFPAQVQDVKAAVRFLRANAAAYGIDPARVIHWGGSAGGHLAALAATTCGDPAFIPEPSTGRLLHSEMAAARAAVADPKADCVAAAAIWYGVFDLTTQPSADLAAWLGCPQGACAEAARGASPTAHVDSGDPPMLIVHGLADAAAPPAPVKAFASRLKEAGVPVEEVYLPGIGHGWQGRTFEDTRDASLAALNRTFAFFDRVAGVQPR
jgi:acetyl esterase/lipase